MHFMLDENVPKAVATMLKKQGHKADFIRDYVPPGSPDQIVATVAEEQKTILVSFDGDFENIAPRIPHGHKARFRKLSRIVMGCGEPQAAERLEKALDLVLSEYAYAQKLSDKRMHIWIAKGHIKTHR